MNNYNIFYTMHGLDIYYVGHKNNVPELSTRPKNYPLSLATDLLNSLNKKSNHKWQLKQV